jgi:hypothetical protein
MVLGHGESEQSKLAGLPDTLVLILCWSKERGPLSWTGAPRPTCPGVPWGVHGPKKTGAALQRYCYASKRLRPGARTLGVLSESIGKIRIQPINARGEHGAPVSGVQRRPNKVEPACSTVFRTCCCGENPDLSFPPGSSVLTG